MTELWELNAWELARLVRAKEVSGREVFQAHVERIEAVNPHVNAVTVVLDDTTGTDGPLSGIPMTVKENIDVAGSATTLGIAALRDAVADRDAPHIAELRAAGAVPIGRANMPEFGMRWHTDNGLRGATKNPWSAAHTPGGSSGGDAVAVATGMAPLGMGNDGAGSLRWPAQCCGVAALKPSLGRVAQANVRGRPGPFAFQLLGVHGPIARSVRDLRLAFAHMCGRHDADPWHAPVPFEGPPRPRRVSVAEIPGTHPDVAEALRSAAGLLADAGYAVEENEAPALTRAGEIYTQIMSAYGRVHRDQPPVETIASEGFVRFWAAYEPAWTRAAGEAAFDAMMERTAIARAWSDLMDRTPLVLAPVCTNPAFPVGKDLDAEWLEGWPASMRASVVANLLGLPAVAVPVGEAGGLPQGVQIIGPRFREDLCLDAAAAIEERLPARTPVSAAEDVREVRSDRRDHSGDERRGEGGDEDLQVRTKHHIYRF